MTIIDDDQQRTCSGLTFLDKNQTNLGETKAGTPLTFTVNAVSCSGEAQNVGGDMYKAVASKIVSDADMTHEVVPSFTGTFVDSDDGTYDGSVKVTASGHFELDLYLLIPGGLRGSYFTDAFLSEPRLDLIRTDATVNFTFGLGPITTGGRDFASVRWVGCIIPQFNETYTFWLDIDDQARLWIDNELIIDWWTFPRTSSMLNAERELKASEAHDIVLEYRDLTGNATARLLWSSPSTPLSAIPSTSLFYRERVGQYNFTVYPASVDATASKATGSGVYSGIAGSELSFAIRPTDRFGNFRGWPSDSLLNDKRHMDNFRATATLSDSEVGEVYVPVNIVYDETTRNYRATYRPVVSGVYHLNVTVDSGSHFTEHVYGSPFAVDIEPGATFAPQSLAYGGFGNCPTDIMLPAECSGLHHGMAGRNSTFIIEAYDMHQNRRRSGGDQWSVTVSNADDFSDYHYGTLVDHQNGTYSVSIIPSRSGLNELQVKLNGSDIRGSPFLMNVVANEDVGSASFVQEGMIITALGNEVIKAEIVAEDRWDYNTVMP